MPGGTRDETDCEVIPVNNMNHDHIVDVKMNRQEKIEIQSSLIAQKLEWESISKYV